MATDSGAVASFLRMSRVAVIPPDLTITAKIAPDYRGRTARPDKEKRDTRDKIGTARRAETYCARTVL